MPGLSAARRYCLGDQAGSAGPIHSGLLNVLALIADYGVSFRSLSDPWADTTTPHGRLMLTVLGGLAEFERHLILSRTNEGRVRAKARGVRFGSSLSISKPKPLRGSPRARR